MGTITPRSDKTAGRQVAGFIRKFDGKMAKAIRSARAAVRKRFPSATELVYDNYNFLVFGFCSTERASDSIVSLTADAKGLGLCFIYGAKLTDPKKILQGSGNQTRFIRLESAATLAKPEVEALLKAAIKQAKTPLRATGGGYTVVKSISKKQRPRRKV